MIALSIYGFISGYATYKYGGGSDELFLKNPPIEFLNVIRDINQALYVLVMVMLAAGLMSLMYLIIYLKEKSKSKLSWQETTIILR